MNDKLHITQAIKAEALRLGFYACGAAALHPVGEDAEKLERWISKGYHAGMDYMAGNDEKRCNPALLVEGAQSVVCVALNYYPAQRLKDGQLQFASYAYGKDYHEVMKAKLQQLFGYINNHLTTVSGRIFCDTAPVLERYWAQQAGLGWIGKNTQLILPGAGSHFFLGELFLDIELSYDTPAKDRCGSCTRCLKSCPTHALEEPHVLNANKCLSYLTIEHRGEIPADHASAMGNRIYGCDQCQSSCPWNRFAYANHTPELQPSETFLTMQPQDWRNLSEEQYRVIFKGSAVKRAKYAGLMRNIRAQEENEETVNDKG